MMVYKNILILFIFLIGNGTIVTAQIQYIENKGQFEKQVLFEATLPGGKVFLEKNQWTFNFQESREHGGTQTHSNNKNAQQTSLKGHAYKMIFEDANMETSVKSFLPSNSYNNYFIGNDESKWASNVQLFEQVVYKNIYLNTDLKAYSNANGMKYDFIVKAGANPHLINIKYKGLHDLYKDKQGNLFLKTSINHIKESKPYAYQVINGVHKQIACHYEVNDCTVSFSFPNGYDGNFDLIIDPELVFSTFTGSTADNWGFCSTYDNDKNLYAGGIVFETGYPLTNGAYQVDFGGGSFDISISKFSPDGSNLRFSTYIGGDDSEIPHSMIVNNQNNLIIMGSTGSSNFPTSILAYDRTYNGGSSVQLNAYSLNYNNGSDIFLTILDSTGTSLAGSTYFGGSSNDGLNLSNKDGLEYNYTDYNRGEIIVDKQNNIYIASCSYSKDLSENSQVADLELEGVVAKFSSALSNLKWSTYIGGDGDDAVYSIELDIYRNIYACGGTQGINSTAFSGINKDYQGGQADGFIIKLENNGQLTTEATYIGTPEYDQTFFIDLDPSGNVYVMGQTEGNFALNGYAVFSEQTNEKQFIQKLSADLNTTFWSTTFGANKKINIAPTAFKVDSSERVLISGWGGYINQQWNENTGNTKGLYLTNNACQHFTDGNDFYFIVFDKNAQKVEYATYFGGFQAGRGQEHVDGGISRFDENGTLYQAVCAGCGATNNFPTSTNVWSNTNNSNNCNLGAVKFDFNLTENGCDNYDETYSSFENFIMDYRLFPNPFRENITLLFEEQLSQNAKFLVYDVSGRLVYEEVLEKDIKFKYFNTNNFSSGIYFFQIISENGELLGEEKMLKY